MIDLDGRTLSRTQFRDQCLRPNVPAIIRNTDCADALSTARLRACLEPSNLVKLFGAEHIVPAYSVPLLTDCCAVSTSCDADATSCHVSDTCYSDVSLDSVLRSWTYDPEKRSNKTSSCCSSPPPPSHETSAGAVYYLKDWHFQSDYESLTDPNPNPTAAARTACETDDNRHGDGLYAVPSFLGCDWMHAFCTAVSVSGATGAHCEGGGLTGFGRGADYRFVYMGPAGSWTGLHHDVFGTYSWSYNVCGDKLWFFPTPQSNAKLVSTLPPGCPPPPDIRVLDGMEYMCVVQHPGDLVFVPAQYYHQVHNIRGERFAYGGGEMDLTISVNHNWCNAHNIECMVALFLQDVASLRRMLDPADLKAAFGESAWRLEAERMLMSGCNWDFASVMSLLTFCRDTHYRNKDCDDVEENNGAVVLDSLMEQVSAAQRGFFSS